MIVIFRKEAKDEEKINKMCSDCKNLNVSCKGTTNQSYTGCIFKKRREEKI